MLDCANAEVGKRLGLPTQGYIALSDAKALDAQAGLETGMGAVLAGLSGINSVSGPGMLDFESCQSLEKLVLDDEICGMVARLRRGIEPRDDFPSRPLFEELLREKHLLIAAHTRKHRKEQIRFTSPVIERAPLGRWREEGETTLGQRASREVERLVAAWTPSRLPDETKRALRERMGAGGARGGHGGAADGGSVREIVRFAKHEAVPEAREVLAAQGLPEEDALAPRLRRLLDEAMGTAGTPRRAASRLRGPVGRPLRLRPRSPGGPRRRPRGGPRLPARRGPRPLRGDARRGASRAHPAALRRGRARGGLDARRGGLRRRRPPRRPPGRALPARARRAGTRRTLASCPTAPATAAGRRAASGRSSTRCGRRRSG